MEVKKFIETLQKIDSEISEKEGTVLPMAEKIDLIEKTMSLLTEQTGLVLNILVDRIETIIEKESVVEELPEIEDPEIKDPKPPIDEQEPIPTKEELKSEYPNIPSLRALKEWEIVQLGKKIGIEGVDLKLKASENDDIVIKWFEAEIWTK